VNRPGDAERPYTPSDYRTNRDIRNVGYDRLRAHGVPAERAREVSARSVDKLLRDQDRNCGGSGKLAHATVETTNPFRVPFDFEK
jgi:hypothetical protein